MKDSLSNESNPFVSQMPKMPEHLSEQLALLKTEKEPHVFHEVLFGLLALLKTTEPYCKLGALNYILEDDRAWNLILMERKLSEVGEAIWSCLDNLSEMIYLEERGILALGCLSNSAVTSYLLDILKNRKDFSSARLAVIEALNQPSETVNTVLLNILQDSNENVELRSKVAVFLGKQGCEKIASFLLATLQDQDANISIRAGAAAGLGYAGNRSAVPTLIKVLQEEGWRYSVGVCVIQALGMMGDASAAPALLECLRNINNAASDNNATVMFLFEALERIGDISAVPVLIEAAVRRYVEYKVQTVEMR
jgi:HEAT repeat protein